MSASPTMTHESTPYTELGAGLFTLEPREQFKAIDAYVRNFDRVMRDWPTLAKMVLEVKKRELWKHGDFPNYTTWVENAAPTCSTTIFENVKLYGLLKDDYSDEDLEGVQKETAYKATQVSSGARRHPDIKKALKKSRAEFVATVKEVAPEQHLQDDIRKTFNFAEQEWDDIAFTLTAYREQEGDDTLSDEKIIFEIFHEWRERKGL